MNNNFLNFNDDELETFVCDICANANIKPSESDKIFYVCEWIHTTVVNATLISMIVENKIKVSDVDEDGIKFVLTNQLNEYLSGAYPDNSSKIWQDISEIISANDNKNFPN